MSWHYLQGREAASWGGISLDGAPDALLSLMPTHAPCCSPDNATDAFRDSQSGTTCRRSTGDRGEAPSTSSQEDSPAKTSVPQGKVQALPESEAVCGNTWRELWVKYDLATSGWRTHRCLWEEALPWSSVTLPKWGMMRGGVLWEQTTPGLLTSGSGFGFWPTPRCQMTRPVQIRQDQKSGHRGNLEEVVAVRSWPTPRSCSAMAATITPESVWDQKRFPNLETVVGRATWPTPTACMQKGSSPAALTRKDGQSRENDRLDHSVMASDGGQLNPTWVEWLMGWPLLWTSTEPMPLETWHAWESAFQSEPTGCAASATGRSLPLSSSRGES